MSRTINLAKHMGFSLQAIRKASDFRKKTLLFSDFIRVFFMRL